MFERGLRLILKAGLMVGVFLTAESSMTLADERGPRIVNGVLTSDYPTAGALLNGNGPDTASAWCTGTLIGCNTFLTAAHCVEEDTSPGSYQVFLQHAGMFAVQGISIHSSYNFPDADVAVITLASSVTGISPTRINTIQDPTFGTPGEIVGFGRSGGSNDDYGLKRAGAVTTASCQSPANNTDSVCWEFESPLGSPGSNSNTCNADSGGPLFLTLGGQFVVAGITSGGTIDSCLTGDASYDTDVHHYRTFIQTEGGFDIDSITCGDLSQVGDADTTVHGFSGQVTSGSPQGVHSFVVGAGAAELRVAMNAFDDGTSDFDLYVRFGAAPTTATYDCAKLGGNQFGACLFTSPNAGTWYAMVRRASGGGEYQVTGTIFGGGCGDPMNAGEVCDDGSACTSNDICTAGACQGTPFANGTECAAGSLCTGSSTCQAGSCITPVAVPQSGCTQPFESGVGFFSLKDKDPDTADKMQWKWLKGASTTSFGDPTNSTNFALCVYDETGDVPGLIMHHDIPAGGNWVATSSGYKYSDRTRSSDGIGTVKLKQGIDGKASIIVVGKGSGLQMPSLGLQQDSRVTVQLVNDASQCWEATYSSNLFNDSFGFKAKAD